MQKVSYRGWQNAYRVANDRIEVIATIDVGPRIIHLAVPLIEGDTLRLIPPLEEATGIQKEMDITLIGDQPHVEVRHLLENKGLWAIELAPWALTVLNLGGVAVVPQSDWETVDNLLPNRVVTLWPYTDMGDPRVHWGSRHILLRQDPQREPPIKVGTNSTEGWTAYYRRNQLLIKCFDYEPEAIYPDGGCSVETYTNNLFLELETLGPLTVLEPGEVVEHVEHWFLYDQMEPVATEDDVERIVRQLAEQCVEQAFGF
jgi:hypothetical protein